MKNKDIGEKQVRKWMRSVKINPSTECLHTFTKFGDEWRGTVSAKYNDIVKGFGKPMNNGMRDASDACWMIDTPHGTVNLYNYKNGRRYLGRFGTDIEDITRWCFITDCLDSIGWVIDWLS